MAVPVDLKTNESAASTALARAASVRRRRAKQGLQVLFPVMLLCVWTLLAYWNEFVPHVGSTINSAWERLFDGTMTPHLVSTLQAVGIGFGLASGVGLLLGFTIGRSVYWYRTLEPVVAAGFAVPRILLYPIMLAIFGFGLEAKIGIGALAAVFPILISTIAGVRGIDNIVVKLAVSLRMNWLQRFRLVYLPASAPAVMTGLRMGVSSAFISIVVAEMVGSPRGLGVLVVRAYGVLNLPAMYATILIIVLIALGTNMTLTRVERAIRRELS